ncbi:PIN domain-containing protein [Luteithermobacter gelatinilyticus]|uniref:PIN domain-containing protein n=1 Tax=Luteithermobacter gelatinilyticus TaxID=2582913 RepID=UPI00319E48D2
MGDLKLPDVNDRHVLAAALKARADMIVTYNLADFPEDYLWEMQIEIQHPDDFVLCQIDLNYRLVFQAISKQLQSLKAPPLSVEQYLVSLEKRGLTKSAFRLRELGLLSHGTLAKPVRQPPFH